MSKDATSHNKIQWCMKLEEEKLAWLQGFEITTGGSPKVHFREIGPLSKVIEPILISNGDNKFDGHHRFPAA
jgi:hypothetical protein